MCFSPPGGRAGLGPPDNADPALVAAGFLARSRVESGHGCPLPMTYAAVRALRADGHKWFTCAPMNDVSLVLAQAASRAGPTCFLVRRVLPDGSRNRLDVVRLEENLGNRSNASAELELRGTPAPRLAAAVDRPGDRHECGLRRIGLPLAKFWVCRPTPAMVADALECPS